MQIKLLEMGELTLKRNVTFSITRVRIHFNENWRVSVQY